VYTRNNLFLQLVMKLQCWIACKGVVLTKKKLRIPGALSLSLSPPQEEKNRGEVWGSWTLVGSNHPISIFGQHVPYLVPVRQSSSFNHPLPFLADTATLTQ